MTTCDAYVIDCPTTTVVTVPDTTTTTTTEAVTEPPGDMPVTGADIGTTVAFGGALVLVGLALRWGRHGGG